MSNVLEIKNLHNNSIQNSNSNILKIRYLKIQIQMFVIQVLDKIQIQMFVIQIIVLLFWYNKPDFLGSICL
jgi:hypothetical protein